jgi:hypothetical protein
MKKPPITRYLNLMGLMCSLVLLSACATPLSKEKQIEKRVTDRWDTIFSGDLAGAYEFLSPGYRSSVSSSQYQRTLLMQNVKWTSAEYMQSECEESTCVVRVTIGYTIYGALRGVKSFDGTQILEESWVLAGGQWYFVPATE